MEFKKDEIDRIHTIWIDESQDIDYISDVCEIEREKVMSILNYLQKEGKIKGFNLNESQILTFKDFTNDI
jgi:hypothetical protein